MRRYLSIAVLLSGVVLGTAARAEDWQLDERLRMMEADQAVAEIEAAHAAAKAQDRIEELERRLDDAEQQAIVDRWLGR